MSEKVLKEVDHDKLRFIRVFTPMHIPKELIEQVRDREYDVEDWYKYQEVICLRQTDAGPQLNPLSLLYVIADEDNNVVGMLWCEIEALSKTLIVQTFSMDKRYWGRGKAVALVAKKAKEIAKECKLKRIIWCTNYPKHSQRYGFEKSKSVLMEYHQQEEEEDGKIIGGKYQSERECSSGNPGADGLSSSDDPGIGSRCTTSIPAIPATV